MLSLCRSCMYSQVPSGTYLGVWEASWVHGLVQPSGFLVKTVNVLAPVSIPRCLVRLLCFFSLPLLLLFDSVLPPAFSLSRRLSSSLPPIPSSLGLAFSFSPFLAVALSLFLVFSSARVLNVALSGFLSFSFSRFLALPLSRFLSFSLSRFLYLSLSRPIA